MYSPELYLPERRLVAKKTGYVSLRGLYEDELLSSFHVWIKTTLVFVPVCGLKVFGCRPTTARSRARSEIQSRIFSSPELLKRPCGKTIAARPPGFKNSKLRSRNRISRPTLLSHFPFVPFAT